MRKPDRARSGLAAFPKCNVYVFGHGAKPLPVHHLDAVWRVVRTGAGLDGVRLHDLRHSFASAGVNAGLDLRIVGGHAKSIPVEAF